MPSPFAAVAGPNFFPPHDNSRVRIKPALGIAWIPYSFAQSNVWSSPRDHRYHVRPVIPDPTKTPTRKMSTGMSAYSCMRSIKRVRPSPRNDRSVDLTRSSPGPFRPLSRFRRAMHATCRTISPTWNSIDRTIHNSIGVGSQPARELWRSTAGQFHASPVYISGARGLVTTPVSRSQTATVESNQPPDAILEDAPPVTDEDLSEPRQKVMRKEVRYLQHMCRQSRNLRLEFKFSELAQLFGEETCRAVFQMKGQEKVTVTCSAPTKVCSDYPI